MTEVVIAGIGQTPVGEHWDVSLRTLAARAIQAARAKNARGWRPRRCILAIFWPRPHRTSPTWARCWRKSVALEGIEGITVEAAEASGAAAFHLGYLAIASGLVDTWRWWLAWRNIPMWLARAARRW